MKPSMWEIQVNTERKSWRTSQPSSLQVKGVTMQSTAGNTIMTLTGNITKYWTLRKLENKNHQKGNLLRRK